jgi:hypothetical protein
MARQVLPIVGAVIGAYFGNPQLGYMIGSIVGNAVDPLMVDGPKIGDVANQTSSEGVYQPIYFGTAQGAGNIIAQGPNVIRRREESQGKGGGPITVTEYLYKTFAIRIGVSWKGETGIVGVTRIWENGKLVYDIRPGSTILAESTEFATKFRLYLGTDDQLPDPSLEAIYGVGNTPSYRGRAYIVFPLYDITAWKAIPQYLFEVVTGGEVTVASTVAVGEYSLGTGALNSEDGISWDGYFGPAPSTFVNMMADEEKVIAWSTTKVSVSYDTGQTWTENPTNYFGGNLLRGAYSAGLYLISREGPFGILKSNDGYNYVVQDIGGQSRAVAINSYGLAVAVQFRGFSCRYSAGGETWSAGGVPDDNAALKSQYCNNVVSDGNIFVTVGGDGLTLDTYFISSTVSGVSWQSENVPFTEYGNHRLEVLATGNGIWVCATGEGEIAWRDEFGTWHLSEDRFPGYPNDCTHNGEYFIMVGGETPASGTVIMYSVDGNTWTAATHPEFSMLEAVASSVLTGEVTEDPPTLDQVIAAIHSWCGQPASEYDVSDLSDIVVRGYILSGGFTGKDAINTLQNLWMIDSPEYDKKIHYRKRGQNTVGTYTFDDLIDEPEDSTREQAIEYPKKLHLDYQSPDVDYAPAKATSSRSSIDARVIGEISVQVPVVLTPTEAFQRANVLHKVSWADADGEVIFSVPDENLHLVPGDCIQLSLRGSIRRLRIDKIEYFPGTLKLTCRGDRQSAYTSNVEGLTPPPPTPPPPSIVGPTMIVVGDWPALRDTDDVSTPVKYLALGGISPAWRGAQADESTDGGNTYTTILNASSPSIMGTLTEDISDAAPYFTDTTNVLTIQLDIQDDSVELPTLTQQQFLTKNGGIALVKDDGTFELMQYRDSNDLGEGLFELSYLQRGRLNSTTSSFSAGDRFVLLSSVSVVPAPVSQIGVDMYYRATSYGQTLEDGTVVNEVFEGNSQTEWPVAHVILERSGDTINGTIVPRHRLGTETNPVRSINWTNYEITLQDSVDQVETLTQVSDTFSYDATSMTFPVTVTVYQVNRLTGAGPGKSEVIE